MQRSGHRRAREHPSARRCCRYPLRGPCGESGVPPAAPAISLGAEQQAPPNRSAAVGADLSAAAHEYVHQQPLDRQVSEAEAPHAAEQEADSAEHVLRPLAEAGEERDRQQIEKPAQEPPDAVLRMAVCSRAMIDRSSVTRKPRAWASTGMNRCISPYSRIS